MGMGDTLNEAFLRATDYLLPGNQKKLADKINIGRYVFFNDHSRVIMNKDHHQYDLEEFIELSKKKENV